MKVAVLFSGNASSIYCHHQIRKVGVEVRYLVTSRAPQSSRMYPQIDAGLSRISARSLAIPLIEFGVDEEDEISPPIEALASLDIDGLCDGAAASNYRRNRLVRICQKLEIQLVLPLWHKDPAEILADMIEEGFEIMIVMLKSGGLDWCWLGRVLDQNNLDEFLQACDENGIDPMGDSGEFGTFVVAGPHMEGRLELEFEKRRSENLRWLEIRKSRHVDG